VLGEGEGWVVLDWKPPVGGGRVAAYTLQRRRRPDGSWEDIGTSIETEHLVSNQDCGVQFEYRATGVSRSGKGQPSGGVPNGDVAQRVSSRSSSSSSFM